MIDLQLLFVLLHTLSVQELREVHGLTKLEMPWIVVELVIHAMTLRRMMNFEVPEDLQCIEFFAGPDKSSQIAKAFAEMGLSSLAFDVLRSLALT